ncbi:MAG: hypothetical protein HRF49_10480 [bacterium]
MSSKAGRLTPPPLNIATLKALDYIVTAITTGRNLERISDAVAEAIATKLARHQKLELDAQFIADAVLKRIEEERQIQRLATEIIRRGAMAEEVKLQAVASPSEAAEPEVVGADLGLEGHTDTSSFKKRSRKGGKQK